MHKKKVIFALLILLSISIAISIWLYFNLESAKALLGKYSTNVHFLTGLGALGDQHVHADFKIFVDGRERSIYTPENFEVNKFTHMHGGANEENVIHVHATGVNYAEFFHTVKIELQVDCIKIEEDLLCNEGNRTLKYILNGKIDPGAPLRKIIDNDKLLISYGSESEEQIIRQAKGILDFACIRSNNCKN